MAIDWQNIPVISKVQLPGENGNPGNTYYIKDAEAREKIEALGSPTHFAGSTTTALTDQATTNPIKIDGADYNAHAGDVVVNGSKEFIFDGTKWIELGDNSVFGDLAYHDKVDIQKTSVSVLGSNTTASAASSTVTFGSSAGANFISGVDTAAVAPSFTEGAFSQGTLPSFTEGEFSAGTLPSFTEGTFSKGTLPSFTEGEFDAGTLPSKASDTFNAGSLPTFSEGNFTPASLGAGFYTPGSAATYSHSGFSGGSLGNATTGSFAIEGVVAAMGTGNDAETLIFSNAQESNAVTAQGTFTAAVYGTDSFNGGTPTVIDVTAFDGGSKASDTFTQGSLPSYTEGAFDPGTLPSKDADTWSAGTLPSKAADTWSAGTLPSKAADSFTAGTLPTKAADTFSAGSAATFTTAKALTPSDTGTAAAQTITVGSNDVKNVAQYSDLDVVVGDNS